MKHRILKKIPALLLAAVMLLSALPIGALAAAADGTPVIYIPDMMDITYWQNPNTLTETEVFNPRGETMQKNILNIGLGLVTASDNTANGAQKINSVISDIFSKIRCDADGNPRNTKVGVLNYYVPVSECTEEPIYSDNIKAFITAAKLLVDDDRIYYFNYDWRLEPKDNADLLKNFIERVKVLTGSRKVSLISGGYGGVVVNGYFYYYADHAKANLVSCVFLDTLATGSSLIGDLMSKDLIRSVSDELNDELNYGVIDFGELRDTIKGADVGNAFSRYVSNDPSGIIGSSIMGSMSDNAIVQLLMLFGIHIATDEGLFEKVGSGYRKIMIQADDYIYDGGLRDYLRYTPGLWAVVPDDSYEEALYFMFPEDDPGTDTLRAKVERAHEVLVNTEQSIKTVRHGGVNVCVCAGYNLQILPMTSCIKEQSDGLQATRYAGLGATTGDMKHGIKMPQQCARGNHNHVEPKDCLDAATCFLPESTWFIRNHGHMDYDDDTIAAFVVWMATGSEQRTVWQSDLYPQYLTKAALTDEISAYSHPTEAEIRDFRLGDVDVNGEVEPADARLALRYALKLELAPSRLYRMIADVNGSGTIEPEDARLILRYSLKLEKKFPAQK